MIDTQQGGKYDLNVDSDMNIDNQKGTQDVGHFMITKSKVGIFKPNVYTN